MPLRTFSTSLGSSERILQRLKDGRTKNSWNPAQLKSLAKDLDLTVASVASKVRQDPSLRMAQGLTLFAEAETNDGYVVAQGAGGTMKGGLMMDQLD